MIRLLITILLSLFFITKSAAKKIEGQLVLENGASAIVTLDIPVIKISKEVNFQKLKKSLNYYSKSGKLRILKPSQVNEFTFQYMYVTYKMASKRRMSAMGLGISENTHIFLQVEIENPLSLFKFIKIRNMNAPGVSIGNVGAIGLSLSPSINRKIEVYVIERPDGRLFVANKMDFRKKMAKFIYDCSTLSGQILDKKMGFEDIIPIVNYYNDNCGTVNKV